MSYNSFKLNSCRIVSASTGVDLKDIEAAESGSNPLNYLTFLIQHLVSNLFIYYVSVIDTAFIFHETKVVKLEVNIC